MLEKEQASRKLGGKVGAVNSVAAQETQRREGEGGSTSCWVGPNSQSTTGSGHMGVSGTLGRPKGLHSVQLATYAMHTVAARWAIGQQASVPWWRRTPLSMCAAAAAAASTAAAWREQAFQVPRRLIKLVPVRGIQRAESGKQAGRLGWVAENDCKQTARAAPRTLPSRRKPIRSALT